jgi:ribosomal protein L12E/L44/L45/RPP1/RPP2
MLMTTVADRKKKVDDKDLEEIIISARSKTATSAAAGPA